MKTRMMAALGAAAILAACGDSTGLGSDGTGQVSLSISGGAASAPLQSTPGPALAATSDTLTDGQNELVIMKAEVVLREIELERLGHDSCDSLAVDDDGCEKFVTEPVLVELPLDGTVEQVLTISVDTGTYDEVELEVHKVSNDDPEDAAFRQAHPDMIGKSVRVQGFFNGQPFTFETDVNEDQEYNLVPPLRIDEMTSTTNVTVRIDLDGWFRDAGGSLFNPQSANKGGANEGMANENIKNSIEAFEDEDRDGDHG